MFTLPISLNKFLLVEIPGTKKLTYLVVVDFTFRTDICACYIYIYRKSGDEEMKLTNNHRKIVKNIYMQHVYNVLNHRSYYITKSEYENILCGKEMYTCQEFSNSSKVKFIISKTDQTKQKQ